MHSRISEGSRPWESPLHSSKRLWGRWARVRRQSMITAESNGWTAASLDRPEGLYYPLPAPCAAALEREIEGLRREPCALTELRLEGETRALLEAGLAPVREALEAGRGF